MWQNPNFPNVHILVHHRLCLNIVKIWTLNLPDVIANNYSDIMATDD